MMYLGLKVLEIGYKVARIMGLTALVPMGSYRLVLNVLWFLVMDCRDTERV